MLPKKLKIDRVSFPTHVEKKRIWNGVSLRIYCYPSSDRQKCFATVVTKKKFSTHVKKNLFKRRVSDAIHAHKDVFERVPFAKFVFYPTKPVQFLSNKDIRESLIDFLKEYAPQVHTY